MSARAACTACCGRMWSTSLGFAMSQGLITSPGLELWLFRVCWCHLRPVCPRSARGLQPCWQQRCSGCCEVSGQLISQLLSLLCCWEMPPRSEVLCSRGGEEQPPRSQRCLWVQTRSRSTLPWKCGFLKFLMRSRTCPSQPGWLLPSHSCCLLFQTHLGADVPCVVFPTSPIGGSLPSTPH